MRLIAFSLENYGNFEAVRLSFDPQPGHLNLVVAPNGGGKTVLRRAFRDFLFGIPGQTDMAFRFGYAGMRLFAEGIDTNGNAFAIGRRKGIGNTLIDGKGRSGDQHVLERLIGEADEALFERLFALDSDLLRRGAEAMLASGGDFAEALFAAGSGFAGLRRLREKFEGLRDQLAPDHKTRSRPFYQALDALAEARRDLSKATVRPQIWGELRAKLDFTRGERFRLAREQANGRAEIERLQRIRHVRPWLEQLESARQQYAAAADAPRLPADTEDRWRAARQEVELAAREVAAATQGAQALAAALAAEQPDSKLSKEAERIDELERARDKTEGDRRDLPRREAEYRQSTARFAELLAALGVATGEEIAVIAPNGPQIAAARDLITRHAALGERVPRAEAEAAKAERDIVMAETALAQLEEAVDISELAARMAEARADGEPARRLAALRIRLSQEEVRLSALLAQVPLWQQGLEVLTTLVPPTRPMIDREATALDRTKTEMAEAEREIIRLDEERRAAVQRLARARSGKPVPDPATIKAARAHRDLGWSLIRRSKFEGETVPAEIEAYAGSLGLARVFERAIEAADDLADRRDEENRRLAQIAEQERKIAELDESIAGAERRLDKARAAHAGAAGAWVALTAALGCTAPLEPGDLREFLTAREAVIAARMARDLAQQALLVETEQQETMRRRFAELLSAEKCVSLAEALAAAQQAIDHSMEIRQKRAGLQAQLETLRAQKRQAMEEANAAKQAFTLWQAEWRHCLTALKRPPSEMPAAVERAIALLEEAHAKRRECDDLAHRIAGMRRNIADFDARAADVIGAAAPDLASQPAELAIRELRRRVSDNQAVESRRGMLLRQQAQARQKLAEVTERHRQAEAGQEALRAEIGGGDDEEVVSRITLAARRRAAESELQKIETKLAEIGGGWPIDRLRLEVAAARPDTIEDELSRLQAEDEQIGRDREVAAGEEQRLLAELQRIEASENAIEAEERRQAAIASATRISSEALLYHAAGCLLRLGLERLRSSGDSSLVRRIGAAFAQITGGAYAGIAADEDEKGTPFLVAIEADGRTEKRVGELSDGTRDQLFLALRLVMVEDYARKAPALPFIADDLLQTFDDYGRTANALAALADLSQHVQVIVLSHQRQLIDIARALPAGTVNLCELAV